LWIRSFVDEHTISSIFETRQVRGFSDEIIFNANLPTSIVGLAANKVITVFLSEIFGASIKIELNFAARFDFWRNEMRSRQQKI
jgi:hypothetical protein